MPASGAHILVYPYPASGHIIPLLDLTHSLLTRGLNVTVVITPNNSSLLHPLLSSYPSSSLQTLVLPTPSWPTTSSSNRLLNMMRGLRELHYPALLSWFQSHPSPAVAILSDFLLGWTQQLDSQAGVPRVVFSSSATLSLCISYALWTDYQRLNILKGERLIHTQDLSYRQLSFPKIPNCPTYPGCQVSRIYREGKEGNPDWELFRSCVLEDKASWGVVFNSTIELERDYIDHIKKDVGHDRVWAVGPLLPSDDDLAWSTSRGGTTAVPTYELLTWLNSRRDDSVVYVCFGSRQVLNSKQTDVLATGLEKSGIHFIWSVRERTEKNAGEDYGDLPDGFEDRVAGRGYIIKGWAPQVAILRHRATGAFLTHCGWNSTLEGISAGVVMLTWPMSSDQFMNAQLLVDELGVGIRVGENIENIPESTKLAQLFDESVNGTGPQRMKARELREAVMNAVSKGGSSDKDLDGFVNSINELKRNVETAV
ncbi:flavonol 3-O-glucosyltransferase UGT89B1-like [Pistacia vera]|uniref:flavonol 3-O-glucosyltransferase UGT89B1-like n=1 Tax=Pistacia vera TaxID=55513 RepID=UPI0012635DBC|nr:flavonol 3-O-glucosyltransferase UGT89B1-like [Pistacia vera]